MDEWGLWHSESILIPMQNARDEGIITWQLLFLNQILIEILFCGRGFSPIMGA